MVDGWGMSVVQEEGFSPRFKDQVEHGSPRASSPPKKWSVNDPFGPLPSVWHRFRGRTEATGSGLGKAARVLLRKWLKRGQ